ncbi:MAG: ATP-binding protein [Oligoflexales bacterium]
MVELYYTIESFEKILGSLKSYSPSLVDVIVTNPVGNVLVTTNSSFSDSESDIKFPTAHMGETRTVFDFDKTKIFAASKEAFNTNDTYANEENIDRNSTPYFYSVLSTYDNSKILTDSLTLFFSIAMILLILFMLLRVGISKSINPIVQNIEHFASEIKTRRRDNFVFDDRLDEIENLHGNFQLLLSERANIQKQRNEDVRSLKMLTSETSIKLHNLKFHVTRIPSDGNKEKNDICYILESVIENLNSFASNGSQDKMSLLYDSLYEIVCSFMDEDPNIKLEFPQELNNTFINIDANNISGIVENLITNAYNVNASKVIVTVFKQENDIIVRVTDDGDPFPNSTIHLVKHHVKTQGTSSKHGMGIGLKETKNILWGIGGGMKISEKPKYIEVKIPIAPIPSWYLQTIDMNNIKKVVVTDDDHLLRDTLKKLIGPYCDVVFYESPESFLGDFKSAEPNTLYITDYCFYRSKLNGIDMINQANIQRSSIILTGTLFKRIEKNYPVIKIYPKSRLSENSFSNLKGK